LRADQGTTVTLLAGSQQAEQAVTPAWTRVTLTMTGDATASSILFGIQLPAGATAYMYGIQAEPQAGASEYKPSTTGGVYKDARLDSDELIVTTTGVGQHACTVNIINVNHL
jgi:tetrahydromethanopterin S-methyltransferase subunit D